MTNLSHFPSDSAVEALERVQSVDDDSLNATAKRVLLDALGIDVNSTVNTVNNDERFQELVDNKTAYLADAMNEIKNSLKAEIDIYCKSILQVSRTTQKNRTM
ncbi:MAG: hypothetical protein V7K27_07680 [Nostoc sp.]|uniref:hypothetical protein n=1 Tax=Nostoc sp. TaxID=1180 RepID=UPI002FF5E8E2